MTKAIWIAGILTSLVLAQDNQGTVVIPGGRGGGIALENGGQRIQAQAIRLRLAGNTVDFLGGITQGPVVRNAPYSAEAVTETTQKLFDGNEIVKKTTAKQYRDSEGRERREEEMGATFITDPVAKVRLTLRPETKTAEQQPFGTPQIFTITQFADQARVAVGRGGRGGPATAIITGNGSLKQEDLGTKTIEGVTAQGTRSTRTIPAGEIGNTRPIEVVDERWYSPDLQITVMTRHSDPREGETLFQLKNIQRIEQVRSLFEAPSDYQVRSTGKTVFWTTGPGK